MGDVATVDYGIPIYGRFPFVLDARTAGTVANRPDPGDLGKGIVRVEFPTFDKVTKETFQMVVYDGANWIEYGKTSTAGDILPTGTEDGALLVWDTSAWVETSAVILEPVTGALHAENIAIGTDDPSAQLHVEGDVIVSDMIFDASGIPQVPMQTYTVAQVSGSILAGTSTPDGTVIFDGATVDSITAVKFGLRDKYAMPTPAGFDVGEQLVFLQKDAIGNRYEHRFEVLGAVTATTRFAGDGGPIDLYAAGISSLSVGPHTLRESATNRSSSLIDGSADAFVFGQGYDSANGYYLDSYNPLFDGAQPGFYVRIDAGSPLTVAGFSITSGSRPLTYGGIPLQATEHSHFPRDAEFYGSYDGSTWHLLTSFTDMTDDPEGTSRSFSVRPTTYQHYAFVVSRLNTNNDGTHAALSLANFSLLQPSTFAADIDSNVDALSVAYVGGTPGAPDIATSNDLDLIVSAGRTDALSKVDLDKLDISVNNLLPGMLDGTTGNLSAASANPLPPVNSGDMLVWHWTGTTGGFDEKRTGWLEAPGTWDGTNGALTFDISSTTLTVDADGSAGEIVIQGVPVKATLDDHATAISDLSSSLLELTDRVGATLLYTVLNTAGTPAPTLAGELVFNDADGPSVTVIGAATIDVSGNPLAQPFGGDTFILTAPDGSEHRYTVDDPITKTEIFAADVDNNTNLNPPGWKCNFRQTPNDSATVPPILNMPTFQSISDCSTIKQLVIVKKYTNADGTQIRINTNYKVGDLIYVTQGGVTVTYRTITERDDAHTVSTSFWEPWVEFVETNPPNSLDAFESPSDGLTVRSVQFGLYSSGVTIVDRTAIAVTWVYSTPGYAAFSNGDDFKVRLYPTNSTGASQEYVDQQDIILRQDIDQNTIDISKNFVLIQETEEDTEPPWIGVPDANFLQPATVDPLMDSATWGSPPKVSDFTADPDKWTTKYLLQQLFTLSFSRWLQPAAPITFEITTPAGVTTSWSGSGGKKKALALGASITTTLEVTPNAGLYRARNAAGAYITWDKPGSDSVGSAAGGPEGNTAAENANWYSQAQDVYASGFTNTPNAFPDFTCTASVDLGTTIKYTPTDTGYDSGKTVFNDSKVTSLGGVLDAVYLTNNVGSQTPCATSVEFPWAVDTLTVTNYAPYYISLDGTTWTASSESNAVTTTADNKFLGTWTVPKDKRTTARLRIYGTFVDKAFKNGPAGAVSIAAFQSGEYRNLNVPAADRKDNQPNNESSDGGKLVWCEIGPFGESSTEDLLLKFGVGTWTLN